MWPILLTAVIALAVVLERIFWWVRERGGRDPGKREAVLEQVEKGDTSAASDLARDLQDPVLRMFWHGLNHHHHSLQGALQVARASRSNVRAASSRCSTPSSPSRRCSACSAPSPASWRIE